MQALVEVRTCFLPLAGIGLSTPLRITESGAATSMWGEDGQTEAMVAMVGTTYEHSQSLNIDAWRQWGLYCGPPPPLPGALFHCTGLLREDGSPRPSYAVFAQLVAGNGTIPTDPDPTIQVPTDPPDEPVVAADHGATPALASAPPDEPAPASVSPRFTG
jgi:hypothetical protein